MEESKKTIFDQLAILYYRKWLFIGPILIGALAGLVISYKLPEYYTSATLIIVEEQQVPEEYVTPADKTPFSQRLNVITQQILSRTKLQRIIKDFGLYANGEGDFLRKLSSIISLGNSDAPASESVIDRMRRDIRFEVVGEPQTKKSATGGNAFTITYAGTDPETTMQVTNTLASLFIEENLKAREQYAEGTSEFLSSELKKSKEELEAIEGEIKMFKEEHMGSLPEQLEANLRTLDRLQLDMQNIRAGIKTAEDRKIYLDEQMKSTQIAGKNSPANPLVVELDRLRSELSMLRSVYKDSYP
ncbi:MAG: Wzz/FepE/Etk N-terminal domain-containing protein, partial [Deltaproteobacteria bacterium]|nr:Wzz/FepE/Etk N-terminal domain-containing protein [Deltaproteobacteria bacterium]